MNDRASAEALEALNALEAQQARRNRWRVLLAERSPDQPGSRVVGTFRIEVSAQELAQRSRDIADGSLPF